MKFRIAGATAAISLLVIVWAFGFKTKEPMDYYRPYVIKELELAIAELQHIQTNKTDPAKMRQAYHESRKHYKHVECFVEYVSPKEAKFGVNGPLVLKNDPEYGSKIFYPKGYQTVEESLFSGESIDTINLHKQVNELIIQLDVIRINYKTIRIEPEKLFELFQLELYRVAALNLNGYDATFTKTNIQETVWVMEGLEELVNSFQKYKKTDQETIDNYRTLLSSLKEAKKQLQKNQDYDSFNRLDFISLYINNINGYVVRFHELTGLPWDKTKKALDLTTYNLFGKESFNLPFFSTNFGDTTHTQLKQKLGEKLFFDPVLSGNGKRSCATCHNPQMAFTDGFPKSIHLNEQAELNRNAPTLLNVVFQKGFFYDGRASQLEQQIFEVVHNHEEMNGNIQLIVQGLQKNIEYRQLFRNAFKGSKDTMITPYAALIAIAEYEKTLISLNSRFDQYIAGNELVLNQREIHGYNIFAGKALCGSCHFFPLFNGTVPPNFIDTEFEVLGTSATSENKDLDPDLGRYNLTKLDMHKFSFKTPTVRNIELTGPYMHNGAYKTLEEVIEFYHKGGGKGFGYDIPNQTLPFDSLQLTKTEKEDIVLFLKSLTDTTSYKR